MTPIINLSRREFCRAGAIFGSGLVLGFSLPGCGRGEKALPGSTAPFVPNAFIRIAPDDTVTFIINKSEMGQGVYTSLPMLIAEELEIDWQKIAVEPAPVAPEYNHTQWGIQGTGGSTSIRSTWEQLRTAGAAARLMLIGAAAGFWGVKPEECRARQGFVFHPGGTKKFSYGQLADEAAKQQVPDKIPLKGNEEFTLLGSRMNRLDTPAKVQGTARFGIDLNLPGMLTAVVERPPVFGARLKNFDAAGALQIAGVKRVVAIDRGVAVVADHFWQAQKGREALRIEWDEGELAGFSSGAQLEQYAALAGQQGMTAIDTGRVDEALAAASRVLEAVYQVPYLAHATMEPLNCVADVRADRCEIWVGTQLQTVDRDAAASLTGLPPEKVILHTMFLGGGFGRRAVGDSHFVREAVQISQQVQAPVKVVWTREDDIRGGYYRPMAYNRLRAGLDQEGRLLAWKQDIVCQSIAKGTPFESGLVQNGIDQTSVEGIVDLSYDVPGLFVNYQMAPAGVPVLWWRSVGHSFTAFAKEGFIDELAHAAGQDPYRYRRQLLGKHPRQQALLDLVADKAGWGGTGGRGTSQGIAIHESFGSIVAQVAEVRIDDQGRLQVPRVVCAIDCGQTVNPDTVEAQMESAIAFGLSGALYGAITFELGRVQQSNFHDYEILALDAMPEIEVHIMPGKDYPGGVGEPGVPPIAPAVTNAVFAATGRRLRTLPLAGQNLLS